MSTDTPEKPDATEQFPHPLQRKRCPTTTNFADVIRAKIAADPVLAAQVDIEARLADIEIEAFRELEQRLAAVPRTADNVPVVIGVKVYCPNGHEHLIGPSTPMSGRIYCCQGDCWSDGCQGDSGGGTHYRPSEYVATPTK